MQQINKIRNVLNVVDSVSVGAEDVHPIVSIDQRGNVAGDVLGQLLKERLRFLHRQWSHLSVVVVLDLA